MIGFCIGNGTSREGFDLHRLDGHGVTIACNLIYNTYEPNYLVALDVMPKAEIEELIEFGWPRDWLYITREQQVEGIRGTWFTCEGVPFAARNQLNGGANNNSGVVAAAYLAEVLKVEKIYMIGIDFFLPCPDRDSNDLLGPTTTWTPVFTGVWNKLVERNPQTEFVRVGEIKDRDRLFYDTQVKEYFTLLESFEDMPI